MAYIFKSGTVKRTDVYDLILNSLLAAGWQNISSNQADGDVLTSTGVNGDKNLVFQMFPYQASAIGMSAANYNSTTYSVRSNKNNQTEINFRLCMKYTPGASGAAGSTPRPAQTINRWGFANNTNITVDPTTIFEYDIYVDKSKLILALKAPDVVTKYASLLYIGLPDTQHVVNNSDSRGLIFAASPQLNMNASGVLCCSDYPHNTMGSYGDIYNCALTYIQITKVPNCSGNYLLNEPYYASDICGEIGKLDGVYMVGDSQKLNHGDIIPVGNAKFKVLNVTNAAWYNSFAKTFVAIQIA